MPVSEPVDLEIKPRFGSFVAQYPARLAAGGTAVLAAILVEVYRVLRSQGNLRVTLAGLILLVVLLGVTAFIYGIRAKIVVSRNLVVRRGWRERRFTREQITAAIGCRTGFERRNRLLALRGGNNECLLCLYADYWSDTDLQSLLLRLGQPIPEYHRPCSARQLRELFPGGGLPLVVARPGLVALMVTPLVIVVIVLVVSLFG
jgi:hypothetical protein